MKATVFFLFTLAALTIAAMACSENEAGSDQTPTATSTASTPEPTATRPATPTPAPTATRVPATPTPQASSPTGIASVDAALKAVAAADDVALGSLAVFTFENCTTAQGAGGPPKCRPGEADGTRVEVVQGASCEGYYLRRDELAQTAGRFLTGRPQLFAVYRNSGKLFFDGQYVIVLSAGPDQPGPRARQIFLDDSGVTGFNFSCGETVEAMIANQGLRDPIYKP